jgi:hypothetical protein
METNKIFDQIKAVHVELHRIGSRMANLTQQGRADTIDKEFRSLVIEQNKFLSELTKLDKKMPQTTKDKP